MPCTSRDDFTDEEWAALMAEREHERTVGAAEKQRVRGVFAKRKRFEAWRKQRDLAAWAAETGEDISDL